MAAAAQVALDQLARGMEFIAQPVHPTLFPYPIAATVHAARISLAYQANARATGAKIPWGTYIAGYLIMAWGGTLWTHHLLHLPPPMLYSPTPYTIYITTHLALTLLTTLLPALLAPRARALLDTALFPLDALVRTRAITSATALLSPSTHIPAALAASPLTHLIIGALASAGGGLTASTLTTWSPAWRLSTPPAVWASMDVWAGALGAGVCGTLSGAEAFVRVRGVVPGFVGAEGMDEVEAAAVAAGVLVVCFGVRVYRNHWAGREEGKGAKGKVQ